MDFARLFVDSQPLIDRIVAATCRRNRLTKEEAEDFGSVVKLKLIANDYAVLRDFCNKGSYGGYLTMVIQRAYQDHRNHLWGKWRPCAEARRLGPLAMKLDTMLHRDGMTLDEACAASRAEDRDEMRRLAARLPARAKRRAEDVEQLEELPSTEQSPEALLIDSERERFASELRQALSEVLAGLPAEDRLLVQLHVEEGATLASLARAYGVDARRLYRRWELLVLQLRRSLEERGYEAGQVAWVLGAAPASPGAGELLTGPSSGQGVELHNG